MVITIGTMIYLGILAVMDAKHKELSTRILLLGSLAAALSAGWFLSKSMVTWEGLMFGALPGGLLLVLAGLDCGAGAGDGIVLIQLDLLLLLDKVVIAFGISLMAMGIFSVVLLCLKKGRKDLRLPYMPFLWLGCLGALGICGIV